jgi:glycosyltransferase involved in cell wall biosynthesis
MKVAIVIQRYGAEINGGAELHARYVAERLSTHIDVRVLATCARDYVTWRNEFPAGVESVNGIPVERFPVARERDLADFGLKSQRVFGRVHTMQEELDWLDSQGPVSPALISRLRRSRDEFDFVLLFCARYYQTYYAARVAAARAVLVPTAEREPALGVRIFEPIFRGVRGIMYNSAEERACINAVSGNHDVPGVVVGVGSVIPLTVEPSKARQKFGLNDRYVVYVGRIDANKGCVQLFDSFIRYLERPSRAIDLVLIGQGDLEIPRHPRIRHLGYVSDQDKFDVIAGSEALVMPSPYESLSMVALESWALGRPVLANAHCDVLLGQCLRSNGGLYYAHSAEFEAVLDRLLDDPVLGNRLGEHGRSYFNRHYSWSVIERKYLDMFEQLKSTPVGRRMEPMPGWLARQRANIPPAIDVVGGLPSGAVIDGTEDEHGRNGESAPVERLEAHA